MNHTKLILPVIGLCLLVANSQAQSGAPPGGARGNRSSLRHQDTALFRIIRSGDLPALQEALAKGSDANATFDGYSALMIAALSGNSKEMLLLLDKGAKVNYVNEDSLTALWMAVPDPEKTILLLDHGADPNLLSKEHYSVLIKLANFPGSAPLFKTMVARGADPRRSARDNTLLYLAASSDDTTLVGLLLREGFSPNDTTARGDYPINSALSYRCFNTLKMLVDNGANVNVGLPPTLLPDLKGLTPLMLAGLNDDEKSFFYLLDHGANVNAKCDKGYTVLMCVQQAEIDHPDLTKALIEHGALVSETTRQGTDALSLALKKGNTRSVQLLRTSPK